MNKTIDEDHYKVLGLPSGEEGSKLTDKQITKAYHAKALVLHPDKRPKSDLQANTNFQRLKRSYEVLKNESSRKMSDKMLRDQRQKDGNHSEHDPKRQKMVSDLEARERAAKFDRDAKVRQEQDERMKWKLDEECARYRAMPQKREPGGVGKKVNGGVGISLRLEEEKVIRVRWEKFGGEGYTEKRLRDLLSKFGGVKDLILGSGCLALVLMETRDAAVAATGEVIGDLSNPLRVSLFQPVAPKRMVTPTAEKSDEPDRVNNLVGVGFRTFEDDVLKKVAQAGQKQKLDRQSA